MTSRASSSSDTIEVTSPQQHYSVAKRDRDHVDIYALSNRHAGDPALKVSNAQLLPFIIMLMLL